MTAAEFVDGVLYLELPWMRSGGATAAERSAYDGTAKAFYDETRPTFAAFASTADGGLRVSVRDATAGAEVYGHDFGGS